MGILTYVDIYPLIPSIIYQSLQMKANEPLFLLFSTQKPAALSFFNFHGLSQSPLFSPKDLLFQSVLVFSTLLCTRVFIFSFFSLLVIDR